MPSAKQAGSQYIYELAKKMQMRSKLIPDKSVYITGKEASLMADAMARGKLSGDGFTPPNAKFVKAKNRLP